MGPEANYQPPAPFLRQIFHICAVFCTLTDLYVSFFSNSERSGRYAAAAPDCLIQGVFKFYIFFIPSAREIDSFTVSLVVHSIQPVDCFCGSAADIILLDAVVFGNRYQSSGFTIEVEFIFGICDVFGKREDSVYVTAFRIADNDSVNIIAIVNDILSVRRK